MKLYLSHLALHGGQRLAERLPGICRNILSTNTKLTLNNRQVGGLEVEAAIEGGDEADVHPLVLQDGPLQDQLAEIFS